VVSTHRRDIICLKLEETDVDSELHFLKIELSRN